MKKLLDYVSEILTLEESQKIFLRIFLISFIGILFYRAFCCSWLFMDTVEHIHASYLISIGKIPYKDFFEHHNPLLWYLLIPVTKIFHRSFFILPAAQCIGVIGYLAVIWLSYKINSRFIYGKKAALFSVIILLGIPHLWKAVASLRPDIFMLLCFLGAFYYFLDYLEKNSKIKLIVSYFLMSLAFLFLQKIAILGGGFLFINLYYLCVKKIRLTDFVIAGIFGAIPLVLFFSYLVYNGALSDWFYCNFTLNVIMRKYYDGYIGEFGFWFSFLELVSFVIILRFYKWKKIFFPIAFFYFLSFLITATFSPFVQYYYGYFIFASILLGKILSDAKHFKLLYTGLVFFAFAALFTLLPTNSEKKKYQRHINNIMTVLENTDEKKSIISLTQTSCNLFNISPSYYWFGFHNIVIIDVIYNPKRYFDLKNLVDQASADIICYNEATVLPILYDMLVFQKSKYFIKRNNAIITKAAKYPEILNKIIAVDSDFWQIDEAFIKMNYTRIGNTDVWKRKSELKEAPVE